MSATRSVVRERRIMCGIFGYVTRDVLPTSAGWAGLCDLTDRGPDDWGVYVNDYGKITDESSLPDTESEVFIGNRRLSIQDLSPEGNQPMVSDDGTSWIVYNGEVYNYRELRSTLEANGYRFNSDSDTEVILAAYQEYGERCVERFRGMFAFAIWDTTDEQLFAARDRLGIKPFYYRVTDDQLLFSSEVTALLESGLVERQLDIDSVEGFLTFGSVPAPRTIISGVKSLRPGTSLRYDRQTGEIDYERFWSPTFDGDETPSLTEIRERIQESVDLRLRSDVPVGAFLSGGLDSSIVVSSMQTSGDESETYTFSIGFEDSEHSELEFAQAVADEFGTEHRTKQVNAADVRNHLPDIIESMDQPTVDGVNTYFVSQLAAEHGIKVVLSGLGGDELFYGYPTFSQVPRLHRIATILEKTLPAGLRHVFASGLDALDKAVWNLPLSELADVVRSDAPFGAAYIAARGIFTTRQRDQLLPSDRPRTRWDREISEQAFHDRMDRDIRDGVACAEQHWYMQNQLLRDTDMMSMTSSLEVRVPLLDSELVEYANNLSPEVKSNADGGRKALLRNAMADRLPDIITKRDKEGFVFPFASWLQSDLEPVVDQALADDRLNQTPLEPAETREIRRQYQQGHLHWSRLWAVVVLSLWIDEHIADGTTNFG